MIPQDTKDAVKAGYWGEPAGWRRVSDPFGRDAYEIGIGGGFRACKLTGRGMESPLVLDGDVSACFEILFGARFYKTKIGFRDEDVELSIPAGPPKGPDADGYMGLDGTNPLHPSDGFKEELFRIIGLRDRTGVGSGVTLEHRCSEGLLIISIPPHRSSDAADPLTAIAALVIEDPDGGKPYEFRLRGILGCDDGVYGVFLAGSWIGVRISVEEASRFRSGHDMQDEDSWLASHPWKGHAREVLDMEGAIRRAMELPVRDCPDIPASPAPDRMRLRVRSGGAERTLEVSSGDPSSDLVLYAAGLAPVGTRLVCGAPRPDGAEWSLEVSRGDLLSEIWGTVVPPFLEGLLGRISSDFGGDERAVLLVDAFSVFDRSPVRPRPERVGAARKVVVHRGATGALYASGGDGFLSQDLELVDGEPAATFSGIMRAAGRELEFSEETVRDPGSVASVLSLFDGLPVLPEDATSPWWIDITYDVGTVRLAGTEAVPYLERMREHAGPMLVQIASSIRAWWEDRRIFPEGVRAEKEIILFDGPT